MSYLVSALSILCGAIVLGSISIRRAGWLDRIVAYHKNKFFDELRSLPPIQIKATIEPAPPGYKDSQDWDLESVERLLILIRDSEGAKDVRRALRRSLGSSRRFMSIAQSYKAFPSLMKGHDDFYDTDSGEFYADVNNPKGPCSDKDIIVISNPVEARLPSASISVGLLKTILENRAKAARYMPTTKKIIPWSPIKNYTLRTTTASSPAATTETATDETTTTNSTPVTPNETCPNPRNITCNCTTNAKKITTNCNCSLNDNCTRVNCTSNNCTTKLCPNPKNVTCNCTLKDKKSENCNCTKDLCLHVNCSKPDCTNSDKVTE